MDAETGTAETFGFTAFLDVRRFSAAGCWALASQPRPAAAARGLCRGGCRPARPFAARFGLSTRLGGGPASDADDDHSVAEAFRGPCRRRAARAPFQTLLSGRLSRSGRGRSRGFVAENSAAASRRRGAEPAAGRPDPGASLPRVAPFSPGPLHHGSAMVPLPCNCRDGLGSADRFRGVAGSAPHFAQLSFIQADCRVAAEQVSSEDQALAVVPEPQGWPRRPHRWIPAAANERRSSSAGLKVPSLSGLVAENRAGTGAGDVWPRSTRGRGSRLAPV